MGKTAKFTDEQLYRMAVQEAYDIDKRRRGQQFTDKQTGTEYTVVDIQHDTQTGFDAMAVKDDKGNIMVIYGGTAGASDVVTDAQIAGTYLGATPSPAQFDQAKAFRNRVVKDNPGADITLTGHSLGGGMSNAVALDSGDKAVNFNPAPLPYDMSTVYGNGVDRTDIINYQTSGDPLRAGTMFAGGYLPGQAKVFTGGDGSWLSKEQHNMKNVRFDSEGNLVDVNGNRVSDMPNTNLNTGNKYLDEATRGKNMIGAGVLIIGIGGITMATGAFLFTFGGPIGMIVGSVLMIAGALVCVVGAVVALIGLFL